MSINIPGELEWLGWIAGSDWPDGDEDKMWEIGGDWRTAAAELRQLLPDLRAAKRATIGAYPWGDGIEAMTKALDKLEYGPESLEHLAEILDYVAESADGLATEIEYTKILIISSLGMLAVEIAAAWLFPPTAPLAETLAVAATRVAVRLLGERAVSAIARFAAKTGIAALTKFAAKHVAFSTVLGAGQDVAIQAYQVGAGHRKDIDWERVGTTAYTAAAAGAVGGPAGSLLGKAAGKIPLPGGRFGDAFKGAVVGAGSGIAGGLAAWGAGGIANGWTWDPRILTSGGAYGVLTGGSKGFRHSPNAGGPGGRPFNAANSAVRGATDGVHAPARAGDGSVPRPQSGGESSNPPRAGDLAASHVSAERPIGNHSPTTEGGPARRSSDSVRTMDGSAPHAVSRGDRAAVGADGRPAGSDGRSGVSEPRGVVGENRAAAGEGSRLGGESRAGVADSSAGRAAGESNLSAGHREAEVAATQPEPTPVQAGSDGSVAPHGVGEHAPPPTPHAPDPLTPARDTVRSLGVDPDGMSPRELERASTDAVIRRLDELTTAAADLADQGLRPAEFFAHRDAIQRQIADTLALRGDLRAVFQQYNAGTTPAAGSSNPTPEARPEQNSGPEPKLRRLGLDPEGMSPGQMRRAAEDVFARKADEFADRTAALEGAGLRPDEFRAHRIELQKQIDEFLGLRRDLRADLPETTDTRAGVPNAATTPRPEHSTSGEQSHEAADIQTPNPSNPTGEFPDTTSKIPYTPRYFGLPPIQPFEAAEPLPDSVWQPQPQPQPEPEPQP
ncbi:hypothetical protein AB0N05_07010, partial [Nocardia sp. NPDC051030]